MKVKLITDIGYIMGLPKFSKATINAKSNLTIYMEKKRFLFLVIHIKFSRFAIA